MNTGLRLAALAAAAFVLLAAAPASACSLVPITSDYIGRTVKAGQATWVGRVSAVTVDPKATANLDMSPDGKATIVFERRVRGHDGAQFETGYNAHPFCGYPWSPKVGDRLLVIEFPNGQRLFTEDHVAGSRYARYFAAKP